MYEFFDALIELIPRVLVFAVIVLAAERIGRFGSRWRMPLITGYLAAGFLAGPDILGIVTRFSSSLAAGFPGDRTSRAADSRSSRKSPSRAFSSRP